MFNKLFGTLVACVTLFVSSSFAAPAAKVNAKDFKASYTLIVVPVSGAIYDGQPGDLTPKINVAANGKITGTWLRNENLQNAAVTITGAVSKIIKKGKNTVATFAFDVSDGAKCKGSISFYKAVGQKVYTVKGKISLNGSSADFVGTKSLI